MKSQNLSCFKNIVSLAHTVYHLHFHNGCQYCHGNLTYQHHKFTFQEEFFHSTVHEKIMRF